MAALPIKPLDGADGYLRWKESVLLRLHTVGVAHVLSDDPPSRKDASPDAAKKWAREDAVCRGHILASLSDRLLPDYVRHATGRAAWEAVARTYDLAWNPMELEPMFQRFVLFQFDEDEPLLEQIAHAEALAATKVESPLSDAEVARKICWKLPRDLRSVIRGSERGAMGMDKVWRIARTMEETRIDVAEQRQYKEASEEQEVKGKKASRRHRRRELYDELRSFM